MQVQGKSRENTKEGYAVKMKKWIAGIALACLGAVASAAGAADVINIGAIGPLTGGSSIAGLDERDAKIMAIDEVNAKGGILGKKVVLFSEDDASQPSQAASVAMKMINQNSVTAIVGAHNSPCTLAVMQVVARAGVPLITSGSTSPKVTESDNAWVVRASPPDSVQAAALVQYALAKGFKNIGIIYLNDDYGKGGYNAVAKALESKGLKLAGAETFMSDDKDMRAQLTKLKSQGVDALLIWTNFVDGSLVMRQTREIGWNVQFFTGTGVVHNRTFELVGEAFDGTIETVPFIPNAPDESVQKFVKDFEKRFGRVPSQPAARAYDATRLLFAAIEKAGSLDKTAIRDAMRNTKEFTGLQGTISINPANGEYQGGVMIVKANFANKNWDFIENVVPK